MADWFLGMKQMFTYSPIRYIMVWVYLRAFDKKLKITFSMASKLAMIKVGSPSSSFGLAPLIVTSKPMPLLVHALVKKSPQIRPSLTALRGDSGISCLPALSFWKSKSWLTSRKSRFELRSASSTRGFSRSS